MEKGKAWWNNVYGKAGRKPSKELFDKIFDLVPSDREMQAKELKTLAKQTGVASDTLYRYLRKAEQAHQITRRVDTSKWPHEVWYKKSKPEFFFMSREAHEQGRPMREIFPKMAIRSKEDPEYWQSVLDVPDKLKMEFLELVRLFYFIMSYAIEHFKPGKERNEAIDTMTTLYFEPWRSRMKLWAEAEPRAELDKAMEPFNKMFYKRLGVKDETEFTNMMIKSQEAWARLKKAQLAFLTKYRGEEWVAKTTGEDLHEELVKLCHQYPKGWARIKKQFAQASPSRKDEKVKAKEKEGGEKA